MSNKLVHVHSFRVSDQGERELMALMRRFQIFGGEQGPAFRLLLERVSQFFRELDIPCRDVPVDPGEMEQESAHSVLGRVLDFRTREEIEVLQDAELKMRGKVGHLLFGLTIRELNKRGIPTYPQNMKDMDSILRKKLQVPETNCDVTAEEVLKRYHLLFGGDLRKPSVGQLMSQ